MKRLMFAAALAVATASLCAFAQAQTGPTGPGGKTNAPTQPGPIAQPVSGMTDQSLEAAIRALDPNVKLRAIDGGKCYDFKIVRDGWTYLMSVEAFQNTIWINAELSGVITAPQSLPAGVLAELLKANFKIGPAHFAFNPMTDNSGVKLFLCRNVGRPATAESFNTTLNAFLKTVQETYPTWSQIGH